VGHTPDRVGLVPLEAPTRGVKWLVWGGALWLGGKQTRKGEGKGGGRGGRVVVEWEGRGGEGGGCGRHQYNTHALTCTS